MTSKLLPIWFDRRNGVLVHHEKGVLMTPYHDIQLLQMTGIRLWEDKYKTNTAQQMLEEYVPGLWH